MKRRILFPLLALVSACAMAQPPLTQALPPAYEAFAEAVYETTRGPEELSALYRAAQDSAAAYGGGDELFVLSLCDFMMGMDRYFHGDGKKAGEWFDKAQAAMEESRAMNDTALATAYLAQIIMQNAAVKGLSFQLKHIPKLPDIMDAAMEKDASCTQALFMRSFYDCTVPPPYGRGYLTGADGMKRLLEESTGLTRLQTFSMLCARGYALAKKNKKADAASCYEEALRIFPTNSEAKEALSSLRK